MYTFFCLPSVSYSSIQELWSESMTSLGCRCYDLDVPQNESFTTRLSLVLLKVMLWLLHLNWWQQIISTVKLNQFNMNNNVSGTSTSHQLHFKLHQFFVLLLLVNSTTFTLHQWLRKVTQWVLYIWSTGFLHQWFCILRRSGLYFTAIYFLSSINEVSGLF